VFASLSLKTLLSPGKQAIRDADKMMRQLPDKARAAAAGSAGSDPAAQAHLRNCTDQLSSKIDEIVQHAAHPDTEADAEASVTVSNDLVASLGISPGSKVSVCVCVFACVVFV
jgi:Rod binding domain-containing protein